MKSAIIKGWKTTCCGRSAPLANIAPESSDISDSAGHYGVYFLGF
jgi:hypothetical protein